MRGRWVWLAWGLAVGAAQTCGGFKALPVQTPSGLCVGVVAEGLRFPRGVLPLPSGDVLVVEMGGWNPRQGALTLLQKAKGYAPKRLLEGLDRPNGIVLGPDGLVYVGEVGRIFRYDLATANKAYVISNLPGDGLHPLTAMLFDAQGNLLVNVGSATDNCQPEKGRNRCLEAQTHGLIRRYGWNWSTGKTTGYSVHAWGLRNSMALALHPSGTVLQGENSRDAINAADPSISDNNHPADEINVLQRGQNYGWPYCYEKGKAAPEFAGHNCSAYQSPAVLLPAHSAPLGMTYWLNGPPEYRGWLVVGYHGYRPAGHRVVGFAVDAKGVPNGAKVELIGGWQAKDGQTMGAPTDLKVGANGWLYISEDRNGRVVVLLPQGRHAYRP